MINSMPMTHRTSCRNDDTSTPPRRGMLILLVVLMLALFMAIGAWLLTISLRSRASAKAFGASTLAGSSNEVLAREALDEALMALLRGSAAAGNGSVAVTGTNPSSDPVLENLLLDKYGSSITGSAQVQSIPNPAFFTLSLTHPSQPVADGSQLNGRILTLAPPDGDAISFRILGASGSAATISGSVAAGTVSCLVATPPGRPFVVLPKGTVPVVINGREFTPQSNTTTPENYDAYDDQNKWLAEPVIKSGNTAGQLDMFNRVSFYGSEDLEGLRLNNAPNDDDDVVDNDSDGIIDGLWIPRPSDVIAAGGAAEGYRVIPTRSSPLGGSIRFEVSYLILDLDGRININATGGAEVPSPIYSSTPQDVPLGMGYGPADLDPSRLFPITLPSATTPSGNATWARLLKSGTLPPPGQPLLSEQRRSPPIIGFVEGRYGLNGTPGVDGDDTRFATMTCALASASTTPNYFSLISGTTSLADLKAARKVYMQSTASGNISPTLTFFTGTTALAPSAAAAIAAAALADAADDPYELRLDYDAPRFVEIGRVAASGSGAAVSPLTVDNPFVLPEMEAILRATDGDATQLPQRLAASLGGNAQQARMTITTDSWDTPALTGVAARLVEDAMIASAATGSPLEYAGTSSWRTNGAGTTNAISPDVAAGLRFDLNRPLNNSSDRYEFCKGLYNLVLMLRGTGPLSEDVKRSAAQWAANAVDFRDEDDEITIFEYDTASTCRWNADGNPATGAPTHKLVGGSERPDIVIAETAASDGSQPGTAAQLLITLRRMPHTMNAVSTSGTTQLSPASLSLTSPVWQIRCPGNLLIRFPAPPATTLPGGAYALLQSGSLTTVTPSATLSGTFSTGTNTLTTGSSAHVCISMPSVTPPFTISGIPQYSITAGGTLALPTGTPSGTVFLERLANPANLAQAGTPNNPYIVVDQAVATVDNQTRRRSSLPGSHPHAVFWAATSWQANGTSLGPFSGLTAPWYHWPNRPFISQAELALVPTGTAATYRVFTDPQFPKASLIHDNSVVISSSGTSSLGNLLLDATYVPSRFSGNTLPIAASLLDRVGFDVLWSGSTQLSKWREPGKVNINTIATGTTGGASVDEADIVWSVVMGGTTTPNPFAGTPRRRTQPANPGGPGVPATPAKPGSPAIPGNPPKSIGHLLSLSSTTSSVAHYSIHETGSAALAGTSGSGGSRHLNPFFTYARAIRLANTATVRSQVFAVWVTVRITDDSPNAPPPTTKRLFAIVDRSIPVGYSPGRDLNVRDMIRVKRHVD